MDIKKVETKKDYAFCIYVRTLVFEIEQEISPLDDFTNDEEAAVNYIGLIDGFPVATVRYQLSDDGVAKIERMAVLSTHQKQGLGKKLMEFIIDDLKKNPNISKIKLGAQNHAMPFYERLGMAVEGEEYMDAGIPHHDMSLKL